VLGFSSGGVVALALAARHPEAVAKVIAWEPAAVGMLPGGAELHAALVAPIDEYLGAHPGDWVGAFHVMLGVISEGQADLQAPEVKLMERNAEAALRDDGPLITARVFGAGELPSGVVTVAVSERPGPLHGEIAGVVAGMVGALPVVVSGADGHEVYLGRPEVLAEFVAGLGC
jgi:pimeloyl-ACP methyl ester carboxylesterase